MRLRNFINEAVLPSEEEIITILKKDCSKWIKESGGIPAFRGMMGKPQWMKVTVRTDRMPFDTPTEFHEMFNKDFKKKFGWAARSEGLFISGSEDLAESYGPLYMIWPIGNYKYIWSKKVTDLFGMTPSVNDPATEQEYFEQNQWPTALESYVKTNLSNGLKAEVEIMVQCKYYYALHYTMWFDGLEDEGVLKKGWGYGK